MAYYKHQEEWLAIAEQCRPPLLVSERRPVAVVRPIRDAAGFQGWAMERVGPPESVLGVVQERHAQFVLDFGEHIVGHLHLTLGLGPKPADAPLRLRLVFGEVPAEIGEDFEPFHGTLSRAWLQDEVINIDVLPGTTALPRRYAFRYLKVQIVDSSPSFRVKFEDILCRAVSSADPRQVQPRSNELPPEWQDIDRVSLRTLANCMQTVFEDGPKRDRRLWLGDMCVQALANYATFRNYALAKRCLYLFAGVADREGKLPAELYERPVARAGSCFLMDGVGLFPAVLHEYCRASGDRQTAVELWEVARRQIDFAIRHLDASGLFVDPGNVWVHIDWCEPLHRHAAMQATLICGIRATIALAREIGQEGSVVDLIDLLGRTQRAARKHFWDPSRRIWVSGESAQVSWASWAWMVLAGVGDDAEAQQSYRNLVADRKAVQPVTAWLYHHVVEALFYCGLPDDAAQILQSYWGGMVAKGASTFWEVYSPADDRLSPYGNYALNSYCHAFGSSPAYFIRKYLWPGTGDRLQA